MLEFEREGGAAVDGCERWLAFRCGISTREAREYVRVARALEELPAIRAAFARGELSFSKVRALTRVATASSEEGLLDLATALTASQLERALRAFRRLTSEEARDSHELEYVDHHWGETEACSCAPASRPTTGRCSCARSTPLASGYETGGGRCLPRRRWSSGTAFR